MITWFLFLCGEIVLSSVRGHNTKAVYSKHHLVTADKHRLKAHFA